MTAQIIHHLWQSTLCAGVAWALAATLRRYSARLRYLVWLVASLKFVVPFSALMALGLALRPSVWHGVSFIQAGFLDSAALFVQPTFSASITQPVLLGTSLGVLITLVWGIGSAVVFTSWILRWLRIRSIVSAALPYSLNVPIDVRVSAAVGAPCVFGIFEPVLLLPYKVISRMSAAELSAVCEHELCHVRRCDNMMAALHMLVTGIFWFHPVVWWIGRHLLEERERACDEHVIESGTIPRVYAEGILKACHVSIESRLELAASASGGHLQKRIEAIVRSRPTKQLGVLGRAGLIFMGCAVLAVPVSAGVAASRVLVAVRLPIGLSRR